MSFRNGFVVGPAVLVVAGLVAALSLAAGCKSVTEQEPRAEVVREGGAIFIVDQTGKRWDVTHAVNRYGFVPEEFQFGLGPNAIKPINNPQMIAAGQPGYPPADRDFLVIGAAIAGESRAYRVSDLTPHEIVNESFAGTPALVGW